MSAKELLPTINCLLIALSVGACAQTRQSAPTPGSSSGSAGPGSINGAPVASTTVPVPGGCTQRRAGPADAIGCYMVGAEPFGVAPETPLYWHIHAYPTRAAAEAARGGGLARNHSRGARPRVAFHHRGHRVASDRRRTHRAGRAAPGEPRESLRGPLLRRRRPRGGADAGAPARRPRGMVGPRGRAMPRNAQRFQGRAGGRKLRRPGRAADAARRARAVGETDAGSRPARRVATVDDADFRLDAEGDLPSPMIDRDSRVSHRMAGATALRRRSCGRLRRRCPAPA